MSTAQRPTVLTCPYTLPFRQSFTFAIDPQTQKPAQELPSPTYSHNYEMPQISPIYSNTSTSSPQTPTFPSTYYHQETPEERFTTRVRHSFAHNPSVLEIYKYALKSYKNHEMPLSSLLRTVEVLFAAHPHLLRDFEDSVLTGEARMAVRQKREDPAELLSEVKRIYDVEAGEEELGIWYRDERIQSLVLPSIEEDENVVGGEGVARRW